MGTVPLGNLVDYLREPYVVGPLAAVALIALTVLASELRRAGPGRWKWRSLTAWLVPAATTGVILVSLIRADLDGAGQVASILSLFVAVMANFGQWLVIIRSPSRPHGVAPGPHGVAPGPHGVTPGGPGPG
jgi:hypothetical protein